MRIDIITVLPEMLEGFFGESILARAQKKGLAEIHLHNLRDYTLDKWKRVDDYPYGGSAGMVMQCEPIDRCISALKAERDYDGVIYVSPDGGDFNQKIANEMARQSHHSVWTLQRYRPACARPPHHQRDLRGRLCADRRRTGSCHHI